MRLWCTGKVALSLAALAFVWQPARLALADADPSIVVARVGPSVITRAELEAAIRRLPEAQRSALGHTSEEVRRAVLERVMIPERLYALGAREQKLEEAAQVRDRIDAVLRTARFDALSPSVEPTPAEIDRYFAEHRADFESPPRVVLFRILCPTLTTARRVLDKAKAGVDAWAWKDLARDNSTDEATKYRGGDLGAVAADGSSSEPAVRVDPALFFAAEKVKDGELVPEPVAEGASFAVVWRRESVPPWHRTLAEEAGAIRQVLVRAKLEQAAERLVSELRKSAHVTLTPQLIELLEVQASGRVAPRLRPSLSQRVPPAPPAPSATPRGLR